VIFYYRTGKTWRKQLSAFFENNENAKKLFSSQLFASRVSHPLISKLKSTHILENGKYFSQSKHGL
jgi:hypothetical protein